MHRQTDEAVTLCDHDVDGSTMSVTVEHLQGSSQVSYEIIVDSGAAVLRSSAQQGSDVALTDVDPKAGPRHTIVSGHWIPNSGTMPQKVTLPNGCTTHLNFQVMDDRKPSGTVRRKSR